MVLITGLVIFFSNSVDTLSEFFQLEGFKPGEIFVMLLLHVLGDGLLPSELLLVVRDRFGFLGLRLLRL